MAAHSQALGLRLNYITGFPGFPACKRQIMGLLSFHKHVYQFHKTNKQTNKQISLYILLLCRTLTNTEGLTFDILALRGGLLLNTPC